MPTLLQWSERSGCGATIKLDNGDVVHVSIAGSRVSVRQWDLSSLLQAVLSRFAGPKLYSRRSRAANARTAAALRIMYPVRQWALPTFKNALLAAFANAIWQCASAHEVRSMLEEARDR